MICRNTISQIIVILSLSLSNDLSVDLLVYLFICPSVVVICLQTCGLLVSLNFTSLRIRFLPSFLPFFDFLVSFFPYFIYFYRKGLCECVCVCASFSVRKRNGTSFNFRHGTCKHRSCYYC